MSSIITVKNTVVETSYLDIFLLKEYFLELKNQHRSSKQFLSLVPIYLMKNKVIKQDKGDENFHFRWTILLMDTIIPYITSS